ncbi:hypothetical protein BKI52_14280 [marine bacterium AO1-C]|nr:hypothetical protein BKI52_14280 [marine bacterium AO1-C]
MSLPVGSNNDFIIREHMDALQVEFINSVQTLPLNYEDWLYHQIQPKAQPYNQFDRCPGCGELLPNFLIHKLTGFCYGCRGDDDLM